MPVCRSGTGKRLHIESRTLSRGYPVNGNGKTKALLKLEKKLENWIAQRSLAQILDWFDCIETTKIQTVMGSYRWSTESVARDRLFLNYLGMDVK
jgi:hypothetical protein